MSFVARLFRLRNIAIGSGVSSPLAYKLIFAEDEEGNPAQAKPWQISAYRMIPLRAFSRLWGDFNSITLPEWFRPYGFRFYSKIFGVNLDEMADGDLKHYKNLGEFFYRELKPEARPIAKDTLLTSPCDGKVLELGQLVENHRIEKVKGVSYTAYGLLGSPKASDDTSIKEDEGNAVDHMKGLAHTPFWIDSPDRSSHALYYCVIYLAPGDYHRFHSPAPWVVNLRRHFVGELFSVAPYFQNRLVDLFCLNERVALLGKWKYGFFSMTPVGATNVGSIVINFDKFLKTNVRGLKPGTCSEANYETASLVRSGYPLEQGEEMGGFRLGSTVVLIFEAPKSFKFDTQAGATVKMGAPLGTLEH